MGNIIIIEIFVKIYMYTELISFFKPYFSFFIFDNSLFVH